MQSVATGKFADPITVATHFHFHEGETVADFGAGSGHYLKSISEMIGKGGRLYACEIQKKLVEALALKARELRLSNVYPLWCDMEAVRGTKLQDGQLDGALVSNVLFQCTNKEATLNEIARTVRKSGTLLIIDWSDSFGGLGPHPSHIVSERTAQSLAESAGFLFERTFPAGDHHYGLGFRKK